MLLVLVAGREKDAGSADAASSERVPFDVFRGGLSNSQLMAQQEQMIQKRK